MTLQLLLIVEDSPAALAATRCAVELSRRLGARLITASVLADGAVERALAAGSRLPETAERRAQAAESALRHATELARRAKLEVEPVRLSGDRARCILAEARRRNPDLIVLGREEGARLCGQTLAPWIEHVLEFAEHPVIVVPPDH